MDSDLLDAPPADAPGPPRTPFADRGPAVRETEVILAVERKTSGRQRFNVWAVVALTGVAYVIASVAGWNPKHWWTLIPVLILHEAGHLIAMRAFGYRNVRMFLLPLVGAAATGRRLNVAGWKRAVVALAGPVPSLILMTGLGLLGPALDAALGRGWAPGWAAGWGNAWVLPLAVLGILLNVFNLLPFYPLDGGRVLHDVLFGRSPALTAAFRAAAALGLGAAGAAIGGWILVAAAGLGLLQVASAYRQARLTADLRAAGFPAVSPDGHSIPPALALTLLREIDRRHAARGKNPPEPALAANQIVEVFEALNTRPPGPPGTLLILGAYAAACVGGLAGLIAVGVANGGLGGNPPPPGPGPLPPGSVAAAGPAFHADPPPGGVTVAVRVADEADAAALVADALAGAPGARAVRVGRTALLTPAADRPADAERWREELRGDPRVVVVADPGAADPGAANPHAANAPPLILTADVPDAQTRRAILTPLDHHAHLPRWLDPLPPWGEAWRDAPAADREEWAANRAAFAAVQAAADAADRRGDRPDAAALRAAAHVPAAHVPADRRAVAEAVAAFFAEEEGSRDAPSPGRLALHAVRERFGVRPGPAAPPPGGGRVGRLAEAFGRRTSLEASVLPHGPHGLVLLVRPPRTGAGLPAIVDWLRDRGAAHLRYDGWPARTGE